MELDSVFKGSVVSLASYLRTSQDSRVLLVRRHQEQRPEAQSLIKLANIFGDGEVGQAEEPLRNARKDRKRYVKVSQEGRRKEVGGKQTSRTV